MPSLEDGIAMVLKHSPAPSRALETSAKLMLVVPNSAIGNIGRGGQKMKQLRSSTNCQVNVSPRVESIRERLVTVSGTEECVLRAALEVCGDLQDDPNLSEHLVLGYDEKVPFGAWGGGRAEYSDTSVQLISLASASGCTKRELIENLRKAAPIEILVRHSLLGSMHSKIKGKSFAELVEILSEAWLAKDCDPAGARPPSGDDTAPKPGASSVPSGTRSTSARNGAHLPPVRDVDLAPVLERDMLEEPKPPLSPLRCLALESVPGSSDLASPSSMEEDWDFGVALKLPWSSGEQPTRTSSSHLALPSGTEDSDSSHVPELPCPTSSGGCSLRAGWGERPSRVVAHSPQAVLPTVSSPSSPASTTRRELVASTVTERCVAPRLREAGPLQEGFAELYADALACASLFLSQGQA